MDNVFITTKDPQRIQYLDVAKGLGIILVVLSHLLNQKSYLNIFIYSFHVPLFFCISGVFSNPNTKLKSYIFKSFKRLIIPYIAFFFIGFVFTLIFNREIIEKSSINYIIWQFVFAKPTDLNVGPIWFLPCLFVVKVYFYIINKLLIIKKNIFLNILSLLFIALIAFEIPVLEHKFQLSMPFKTDVAIMALVFYIVGYYLKNEFINNSNFINKYNLCLISLSSIILVIVPYYLLGLTNLSGGIYGDDLFYYLLCSFSGTILIVSISYHMKESRLLLFLGRNSLLFFSIHSLFIIFYDKTLHVLCIDRNVISAILGTIIILLLTSLIVVVYQLFINKLLRRGDYYQTQN